MRETRPPAVPLSEPALCLPRALPRRGDAVFEGLRRKSSLFMMSRQLKVTDATPHGMRSTFSDWAIEHGYDPRLVDCAVAHKLKDGVEATYSRTNRVEERRELMARWAEHVIGGVDPGSAGRWLISPPLDHR
jgi:integrase